MGSGGGVEGRGMSGRGKRQPKGKGPQEPYLAVATVCERVIRDAETGAYTLVNMFDRLTFSFADRNIAPSEGAPLLYPITIFFALRTLGEYVAQIPVTLTVTAPNGAVTSAGSDSLSLDRGHNGTNMTAKLNLPIIGPGFYLLDFSLNGRFLTRIPLEVVIGPAPTEPPGAQEGEGQTLPPS